MQKTIVVNVDGRILSDPFEPVIPVFDRSYLYGDSLYEVALWVDMLRVQGDELFYAYMVDNQAIVIPETIDAIRALAGRITDPAASIAMTDASLGVGAVAGLGFPE